MSFRWGVFGTGAVAAKFVAGLSPSAGRVTLVASRTGASADRFANAFDIECRVEGYAEAARAADVDAVYIATPPSEHVGQALACLGAGIPVLIEKPFARDAAEAGRIAEAARSAGVFCMEGLWTRFLPAAKKLRDLALSGEIGEVRQLHGSFGFSNRVEQSSSSFDPERGGGALAYLGIYPVSLAQWILGSPTEIQALGRIGETGVDEDVSVLLRYSSGVLASIRASLRASDANEFGLIGTHGRLSFGGPVFRPHSVVLDRSAPRKPARAGLGRQALLRESNVAQGLAQVAGLLTPEMPRPAFYRGNGYHYEAEEVVRCVGAGQTESSTMPLSDSIAVARTLDDIRQAMHASGGRE